MYIPLAWQRRTGGVSLPLVLAYGAKRANLHRWWVAADIGTTSSQCRRRRRVSVYGKADDVRPELEGDVYAKLYGLWTQ